MRMTKLSFLFLSAIIFLLFLIPAAPRTSVQAQDEDYEALTMKLREDRCAKCHGPDSFAAGGIDYILDTPKLIENGLIKPGLPEESELYEEVHEGKMPADGTAPLPDEEMQLISAWITALAPDVAEMVEEEEAAVGSESATEPEEKEGSSFLEKFGKFHVLVIHFPIALIIFAFIFEIMAMLGLRMPLLPVNNKEGLEAAARLCIFFGSVFAVVSVILGWILANYEFIATNLQDELFWHRWLGIAVAALGLITFAIGELRHKLVSVQKDAGTVQLVYRLLLVVVVILVVIVGHLGGTLVYGEGYYN